MLVSIIIPVYNSEKYLHDCINSVILQSYNEIEIILIDDGSTDSSGKICDMCAEKDNRIIVLHQKNKGQLDSRLTGMKKASGDYFVFLDSDDMLKKDAVQVIVDKILLSNCDLLVFEGSREKDFSSLYMDIPLENNKLYTGKELEKIYSLAISTGNLNCMCMKAFKADIFNLEYDFSEFYSMRNAEDTLMALIGISSAKRIFYIKDILYYYRVNHNSMSFKYNNHKYEDIKSAETMRIKLSIQWFGDVLKEVYNKNLRVCFNSVIYELAFNPEGILKKNKRIREILKDEFFYNSYMLAEKSKFSFSERFLLFLFINCKLSFVVILLYNIKKYINSKCIKK